MSNSRAARGRGGVWLPGRAHRTGSAPKDERGSGLIELVWLGLILLLPLIYVVVSVFTVQRSAFATTSAARAAGSAYALAPSDVIGRSQAVAAARRAFADQGQSVGGAVVDITCTPAPHSCHSGGSVVQVVVSTAVPLPLLPRVLGRGAPRLRLDARFVVPIGQFQAVGDVR